MARYPQGSLRERKHSATMEEIKSVALAQLAQAGGAMTLRGVAREVGMTVQSLYHYFPSRDDLITALIVDAYNAMADAIDEVRRSSGGESLVPMALAYRAWAIQHRAQFLLIYGTPIPGYQAPDPGPTTGPARRLGAVFTSVVFSGWTAADFDRITLPGADDPLRARLGDAAALVAPSLPPAAFGLFVESWSRMHGLVMLELLRHLPWLGSDDVTAAYYEGVMNRLAADLERVRRGGS